VTASFDSIDWELLLKAVRRHTDCPWVLLYIERWLKAPVQMEDGSVVPRTAGTPQGGVISPLLANLFLHYAFDMWMARTYPHIPFERYADDIICHCKSAEEAQALWSALADRFAVCKLVLHPQKTKIVYCKDANRRGDFPNQSFDFLGFSFRARKTLWQGYIHAHGFLPAARPSAGRSGVGRFTITATSPCKIWPRRTTRTSKAGSTTMATSIGRSCARPSRGSMSMSSAGRAGSSSGCVTKPKERETGLSGFAVSIQVYSPIGSYVMATAEHREPYESRGSRTCLGARGGEIPPRDSTIAVESPPPG
jgi:hypothetical protein